MVALAMEDVIRIGFGTAERPNIAVHFDLFPHVYFSETRHRSGTHIDENGGQVFADVETARAYALKQFDVLVKQEMTKLDKFKSRIDASPVAPYNETDHGGW